MNYQQVKGKLPQHGVSGKDGAVQLMGPVEEKFTPRGRSSVKVLSRIHPINLEERITGGKGASTSTSVLAPTMRIERTQMLDPADESQSLFRIILSFVLQVSILNFHDQYVLRLW